MLDHQPFSKQSTEKRRYVITETALVDMLAVLAFLEQDGQPGVALQNGTPAVAVPVLAAYQHVPIALYEYLAELVGVDSTDVQARIAERLGQVALGHAGDYRS